MVDIHHHLLPGLDDGSPDDQTSLAMARLAVADGITHIVCTPHANSHYAYDRDANRSHLSALQQRLDEQAIPLTLGLGCDFHISYDNVRAALTDLTRFTINASNYLLVELPDFGIPPNMRETFLQMREAGLRLILTHPERNPTLVADPQRMIPWLRDGLLLQVTADSLTGQMGSEAQRTAHRLLANRWVHFIATDAHNLTSRPPRMKQAWEIIERRYDLGYAVALCETNPRSVFLGEPLGVQPEMIWPSTRKSWLDRLLRR